MENVLYNYFHVLGYLVDVGIVESREMKNGKTSYSQCEIDFIATRAVNGLISSWHIQFSLKKNGNRDLYRS